MKENKENDLYKVIKAGVYLTNPVAAMMTDALSGLINKSKEVVNTGTIDELEEEAIRQELSSRISESQAKIEQELAISKRIEYAEEVEIEEYYDINGEGDIGLGIGETGVNIGASGSGRKVAKRIYKFKGWNKNIMEEIKEIR